ncbi:MAG: hypothetical protein HYZ34_04665, partial [Ignavibacteriae bacterium]|nr:hypothetical protein [Ignavibacteriota bacterium]
MLEQTIVLSQYPERYVWDTVDIVLNEGWNLLSLPLVVQDGRASVVFPNALSPAFEYNRGYSQRETLCIGKGYWLKYPERETLSVQGIYLEDLTLSIPASWNIIGSLSVPIDTSEVITSPAQNILSHYYRYSEMEGYLSDDTLSPGKAYWVKLDQGGMLREVCQPGEAPTLQIPDDKSELLDEPILQWARVLCAKSYRLQVSADSLLTGMLLDFTLNAREFRLRYSSNVTEYYWRVGVRSSYAGMFWSQWQTFRWTYRERGLVSPDNKAEVLSSPVLEWRRTNGTTLYRLQVASDSLFNLLRIDTTLSDTSFVFSIGCDTSEYYWRVGVLDTAQNILWTTPRTFRWGYQASALLIPSENGGTTLTPKFRWRRTSCSAQYRFQLATDSLAGNVVFDSLLTDTTYQSSQLDSAQTYYWRIGITLPDASILWTSTKGFIAAWRYLGLGEETISALAVDWFDSNVIYVGSNLFSGHLGSIFKTTN